LAKHDVWQGRGRAARMPRTNQLTQLKFLLYILTMFT
jgi:hypothetical protein